MKKPLVLMILDGYGISESDYGNAVLAAKKPNIDKLFSNYPHTQIYASGHYVGLPDGQMGNSEVGHTNIGAGRIVYQELTRITKSIEDGDFFENPALLKAMENANENNSALHLMGLLSDGGVHSHNKHLYGVLEMAKKQGVKKVFVHAFTDGRDVPPMSGIDFAKDLEERMKEIGVGRIATIIGRYYAMDRDNRWDRVEMAYDAIVKGKGVDATDLSSKDVFENSYKENITDEFILPTVLTEDGKLKENDSVIFYNFRPDRARELTRAIVDKDFNGFKRDYFKTTYVTFTDYDRTMPNIDAVAFIAVELENTFGDFISSHGLNQLRIAETEKYPHVTFFFNGGKETVFKNEDRALIPSPKVATYDLQPEMSAPSVGDEMLKRLKENKYDVTILNFANPDMVGHSGIFDAAVKAIEAVDVEVGKVADLILEKDGVLLLTADHGNSEKMYEDDGSPFTAHTTNPVPFLVAGMGEVSLRDNGILADIAPTMLKVLGLDKPKEMSGTSIINFN